MSSMRFSIMSPSSRAKQSICSKKKVIFLGASDVGKTSLLIGMVTERQVEDLSHYHALRGVDYISKISPSGNVQQAPIKIQLWDTAQQDRYSCALARSYTRHVNGAILVYDVTNINSMLGVFEWTQQLADLYNGKEFSLVLIANKVDAPREQHVYCRQEGIRIAHMLNANFEECSARSNWNVEKAFRAIAEGVQASTQWKAPTRKTLLQLWSDKNSLSKVHRPLMTQTEGPRDLRMRKYSQKRPPHTCDMQPHYFYQLLCSLIYKRLSESFKIVSAQSVCNH